MKGRERGRERERGDDCDYPVGRGTQRGSESEREYIITKILSELADGGETSRGQMFDLSSGAYSPW